MKNIGLVVFIILMLAVCVMPVAMGSPTANDAGFASGPASSTGFDFFPYLACGLALIVFGLPLLAGGQISKENQFNNVLVPIMLLAVVFVLICTAAFVMFS